MSVIHVMPVKRVMLVMIAHSGVEYIEQAKRV